jgi:hypothetical protein
MIKKIKMGLIILGVIILVVFCYFFVGISRENKNINWGVNFSQERAERFGLNWKEVFLAILNDLGARNLKITVNWDYVEGKQGQYFFEDIDWQIKEAEKSNASVILVMGRKTPGWPECHLPVFAKSQTKEEQQGGVLSLIEKIVNKYKSSPALKYWQVENEPFFPFGECSWRDDAFLKKEIELVKSLDPSRQVIISDSGEVSLWMHAAQYGDIVGVTLYRRAWFRELNSYITYPFPSVFYKRKANLIKLLFKKEVMCVELQAEPWGPEWNYTLPVEEQLKSLNINEFKNNLNFAKKTGLGDFYLWGAEWWYWMKEKNNNPEFWEEAKNLFK